MPLTAFAPSARRAFASVQRFRSPLTRVGYGRDAERSYLVLLTSGQVGLREGSGDIRTLAQGPRLLWLSDETTSELMVEGGARGMLVSVPDLALVRALPPTQLGDQIQRTLDQNLSLPFEPDSRLEVLVDELAAERSLAEPGTDVAQAHILSLILIAIWRLARVDIVTQGRAPQGLAERFIQLAAQHARAHWKVEDYAREMKVTRDRLGSAVRRATGLSPQAYLHRTLVNEASELLACTGMPVGQIAFRLGFGDPAYFTRFFTRAVGQTPRDYRRANDGRRPARDQSYAAWP